MPLVVALLLLLFNSGEPAVLRVGPGQAFDRPEAALAKAAPGDIIELVAPEKGELVLACVALRVEVSRLTIRTVGRVVFDGAGFDYSGEGRVPRAIIQVDRAGTGTIIDGLELRNAHNQTANGAGIRINAADHVTVRKCSVTACDMGVMSNGSKGEAVGQRLESCTVVANGTEKGAGLSHNLYLGGEDVTLDRCTIRSSTHGHNLKSRARSLFATKCEIAESAEREVDLVDSELTESAGADAVLEDCAITKRKDMTGNRGAINFGRDGSHGHRGTLTLRRCKVLTFYVSPVITLSASDVSCMLEDCTIENPDQKKGELIGTINGADAARISGSRNHLAPCYDRPDLTR